MYVTGGNVDELNGINGRNVFCYLEDNHTSVLGLREIAADNGAQLVCITESAIVRGTSLASKGSSTSPSTPVYHLFAYPAQSNFSGRKYPLDWTKRGLMFHNVNGVWLILLDAASYAGTNSLDLTGYPAHFVSLSFYKIFGYPTGLGALLVRRDIEHVLDKSYFGGGTVISSIGRMRYHRPRPELHERFEDGTVSFLSIAALRHGFQTLQRFNLTMDRISQHVHHLTNLTYHQLESLKHTNGQPLCVIYCTGNVNDINQQGGILSFNLIRADGSPVGYSEVSGFD
jgi:molybdenum cofactor sulfurtransferase